MVRFSKKLALSSVAAMLLAGGGWMWLQEASALNVQVGAVVTCKGDKSHLFEINNGPRFDVLTRGGIESTVGATSFDAAGHEVTTLKVNDVFSMGSVDGLGQVSIGLDKSRQAGPSTLRSNYKGRSFPATQTMNFFPVIVVNNEVFRSSSPVQVVSSSVESFPPAPGTTYVLTNAVTFKSASGNTIDLEPGKAFSITK